MRDAAGVLPRSWRSVVSLGTTTIPIPVRVPYSAFVFSVGEDLGSLARKPSLLRAFRSL
jgi:hypothetical protein